MSTHPEAALSAREAEKTADPRDRYYGENGAVWKAPIETRKENGTTSISIGFKVCTMTDVVGPEAANTVADLMNAGVAALSTAHTATAGDGGLREAAQALLTASIEDYGLDEEDADDEPVAVGVRDDAEEWKSAVTFGHLRGLQDALAQAPAVQAPAGEDAPNLDARLKAAGMYTVAEMLGVTPLTKWQTHVGMTSVEFFATWLDRRAEEFIRMKAGYDLGDKSKDDELYEWVLAHCGAFCEARTNLRATLAASPTPTDAQPKAARPVGDEALREALKKVVSSALYKNQFKRDWREHIDPVANAVLSFLASLPTTRQETVATPRDGGVREEVDEDGAAREYRLKREATRSALSEQIAALSAPGSAGPGEREDGLLATLPPSIVLDCENQALNLANLWTNGN